MNSLNPNVLTSVRIKPNEFPSKVLEFTPNSVSIRDNTGKSTTEKQTFHFNTVFDPNITQENIFQYVCEHLIGGLFEGTNCSVLSYGQSGSGKSFTIFGEDERFSVAPIGYLGERRDRKGLVPRTIEYLLARGKESKDQIDISIICHFIEIYLDQVRDLGKCYYETKNTSANPNRKRPSVTNFDLENLEIYEHSNGQMLVKNVTSHSITSIVELYDLLNSGFNVRERTDVKTGAQLWNRAHTIFSIQVIQRDPSNDNIPISNATIQFVDLAGSERIAKSITDGQQKFQEAIQISSALSSLSKVISGIACKHKSIPFKESRLTKALYNSLNPTSRVLLIANVNPNENCYEETFMTLKYAEKCLIGEHVKEKSHNRIQQSSPIANVIQAHENNSGYFAAANDEKLMRKMADEISELRIKVEFQAKEIKTKLDKVKNALGLDIDLEKLITNPTGREIQYLNAQKQAVLENESLKKLLKDYEHQIVVLEEERKNDRKEYQKEQNKLVTEIIRIKELMKKDIEGNKVTHNKTEESLKSQIIELKEEIKKLQQNNSALLEQKSNVIFQFNQNLSIRSQEITAKEDQKSYIRKEAEQEFRHEVDKLKREYEDMLKNVNLQYEDYKKEKQLELDHIQDQFKQYKKDTKEQIEHLKNELIELYEIIQKQNKIIEKVDLGVYSGGMRSFNIPSKDKPVLPTRMKFKYLFKYLDQIKVGTITTRTLLEKTRDERMETMKTNTLTEYRKAPNMTDTLSSRKFTNPNSKLGDSTMRSNLELTNNNNNTINTHESLIKDERLNTIKELEDIDVNLTTNIKKLLDPDVRTYCEKLQLACKKYRDIVKEHLDIVNKYNQLNIYGDIHYIIAEKDKYEQLYKEECRKNHEQKMKSMSYINRAPSITQGLPRININTATNNTLLVTSSSPKSMLNLFSSKTRPVTSNISSDMY